MCLVFISMINSLSSDLHDLFWSGRLLMPVRISGTNFCILASLPQFSVYFLEESKSMLKQSLHYIEFYFCLNIKM